MKTPDEILCPGCGAGMEIVPQADYGVLYGFQCHCPRCGWDAPLKRTERDALEAARKRVEVEVVRCKDCLNVMPLSDDVKHYVRGDCMLCAMGRGDPILGFSVVTPDDYCSDGVKANDGGANND